ncbi:MAG: mitochondrial NADH:ubiquinone oxidoreductase 18 kDa subunit [Monoraphidium minutum]|nr:MAG: mitochondrial NADH:ubiquinone oxidoreductase 18 kDa subunit [Monoraphidium minutum]
MLARVAKVLPVGLRASPQQLLVALQQQAAAAYSEGINLADRQTLKKFMGVEDLLGKEADARGTLTGLLQQLKAAVGALPADADYRRAIEATVAYRLKVLDANESDAAVEEVLDSHLEELILECREELNLVPIMGEYKPWDVPADYQVPVYDYVSADTVLGGSTTPPK